MTETTTPDPREQIAAAVDACRATYDLHTPVTGIELIGILATCARDGLLTPAPGAQPAAPVKLLPLTDGDLSRMPGVILDGHGNAWAKCDRPDCDLAVARPGDARCSHGCQRDEAPAAPDGWDAEREAARIVVPSGKTTVLLLYPDQSQERRFVLSESPGMPRDMLISWLREYIAAFGRAAHAAGVKAADRMYADGLRKGMAQAEEAIGYHARAEADRLRTENVALAKFKAYVHQRLDDAGVPVDPDSPHKAEGCRVGGRLDVLIGERDAAIERHHRETDSLNFALAENATLAGQLERATLAAAVAPDAEARGREVADEIMRLPDADKRGMVTAIIAREIAAAEARGAERQRIVCVAAVERERKEWQRTTPGGRVTDVYVALDSILATPAFAEAAQPTQEAHHGEGTD